MAMALLRHASLRTIKLQQTEENRPVDNKRGVPETVVA
jgi:hypothetical protein